MSLTAQSIIDGAFDLCNIKQVGESVGGDDATDALRRLNNLVKILNNQKLVAAFQAREVFSLVANRGTYTIGPNGDFDTTRPFDLDGAAILLNPSISSAYALIAASPTNSTFTVATDVTGIFTSGSEAIVSGGVNDGNYTVVSAAFGGINTVITVAEAVPSATITTMTIQAFTSSVSTIEIPRTIYTDDAWQSIQVKALTNSLATGIYFNANYARDLAVIQIWPIPNVATNALVLYRRNMLATFADLSTAYAVPPGFEELLEYNLAKRLLTPYTITDQNVRADVLRGAMESMAVVKRTNAVNQLNDMPIDPAWTRDKRGYYNILTSNY